jgi:glycosyltransferase involved in cell wall biosynthesis
MKPLLLLSTLHRNHAAHSGYQALAEHLPEARFLHTIRADPTSPLPLLAARIARQASFSRWYLGGCASLEFKAWQQIRAGFNGIVHVMWADHDLGYLDLVLNHSRNPLVGSFHNCNDTFVHTIRFRHRLRKFAAIILMSQTQSQFFLKAGVDPARIHVIPHGVDTDYFHPTPIQNPGPIFKVLAAGGYRRNFPLLREVCLLLKEDPGIRFEIVAPDAFSTFFNDLPNSGFRSGIPDADFLAAYQSASCLIQTVENSTANNVILEAMACGQPVIAERLGGIPEYIDDTCSILSPAGDARSLADSILHLHANPATRAALSSGARARAEALAWPRIANQMRAIYETL